MTKYAVIFLIIFSLHAHAADVTLSTQIDRQKATIGDPIHFSLKISADHETKLTLPRPGESLGQFDILDYSVKDPEKKDGKFVQEFSYTISNYATGTYYIPPVTVFYEENGKEQSLVSDTVEIEIESVTSEDAQDIRELKSIFALLKNYSLYFIIIGALFLAALIGYIIYRKLRKPAEIMMQPKIVLPPYEEALQCFERLLSQNLLETGAIKEYYLELSEIIKRYLGRIYTIPTMERTTSEILFDLKDCPVHEYRKIEEFFNSADLVKFAKFIPDSTTNSVLTKNARDIIESERPIDLPKEENGGEQ